MRAFYFSNPQSRIQVFQAVGTSCVSEQILCICPHLFFACSPDLLPSRVARGKARGVHNANCVAEPLSTSFRSIWNECPLWTLLRVAEIMRLSLGVSTSEVIPIGEKKQIQPLVRMQSLDIVEAHIFLLHFSGLSLLFPQSINLPTEICEHQTQGSINDAYERPCLTIISSESVKMLSGGK